MNLRPVWHEIDRGIRGALRLARRDPDAMASFDLSIAGFYRSFLAALVTAPAYLLQAAGSLSQGPWPSSPDGPVSGFYLGFSEALSYAIGWLVFPLAAIPLTRLTGLTARYVPLVVASNWAGVVQALALMFIQLIGEQVGGQGGAVLLLGGVVLVIAYEWHVLRMALQAPGLTVTGFVLADILLTVLVSQVLQLLLGF